ncbi:jg23524, partial [Pararge aegeria aegeria]
LLDGHFKLRQCSFADKAKFYAACRSSGESLGDWAARLRGLATYCDFGNALETNLLDRFVLGLSSGPERDKLFEQKPSTLTLARAIELAEQAESAKKAKVSVSGSDAVQVKEEPVFRAKIQGRAGRAPPARRDRAGASGDDSANRRDSSRCKVCGLRNHGSGDKCRYKGYRCQKCGVKGHLKKVCSSVSSGVYHVGDDEPNEGRQVIFNNLKKKLKVFVIKNGGPPLLGRDFMSAFNLIITTQINSLSDDKDVQSLVEKYAELWRDELGSFNKFKVKLQLKDNSVPKFFKPRTVPFALKDKVEKELNRLVSSGILIPINFSHYATPIVPVLKANGQVKIAGDFSITLNRDLLIEKYPLPRIEEVFAKLGGGERYSKIDLKNAYNQFVLDDSSQELTTINTHKGLFKYTRLVYGLANAPAIFQKSMETLLSGIDGVSVWLDDICITGSDRNSHLKRLDEVLSKLSDAGLRLEKNKCEFFKESVKYLGYVISKAGLTTCPDKVEAIINAPEPSNVTEVKRFLGFVNYYRHFIPNASALLRPLHDLLRNDTPWEWGARQRRSVADVRRHLCSERVLAHFE